jgi:DNA modification methylase
MIIEIKKISELTPAPYNPRESTEKQESQLKQSLKKFGVVEPIIYNKQTGYIVGGHFRVRELQKLGYTEIECVIVDLAEEDEKELNIRLNANTGQWDWDELANNFELEDLNDWGLEVPNMKHELEAEDDNFEEPETIETDIVLGDLFEIGEHRLLCGDSTDSDAVGKLMNGQKADMVFTSPPYNSGDVAMRGGGNFAFGKKGAKTLYENYKDDKTPQEYFDFCISILNNISLIVNELHSVFWNVSYNANSRDDYGKIVFSDVNPFRVKETIIWNKGIAIPITSEGILSRNSEFVFLMSNGEKYLTNQKIGEKSVYWNTWNISSSGSQHNEHKACFPIELPFRAIEDFSKKNHIVYEPFTGSGTTMVAAHQLKRKCYGMELDPKYCQVIIDRMKKLDPTIKIKRNGVEL